GGQGPAAARIHKGNPMVILIVLLLAAGSQEVIWTAPAPVHVGTLMPMADSSSPPAYYRHLD
ncbi:hypothetical protein ABEW79_11005, partial [Delftia tsuruhatensis]|uniref:hypothetical protein n=1 Tax=Delftia tsuruhatensis TaxID=180282 RepID=UPI003D1E2953